MRLFRKKPVFVVRHDSTQYEWGVEDSAAMKAFLASPVGVKLQIALDDRIIDAAMNGADREFMRGIIYALAYIRSLTNTSGVGKNAEDEQKLLTTIQLLEEDAIRNLAER